MRRGKSRGAAMRRCAAAVVDISPPDNRKL
jgi:hypothetical protein